MRVLAPYMRDAGWEPVVLTVAPEWYVGERDTRLQALVPVHVRVVRAAAWAPARTRLLGIGDLGLRAWTGLRDSALRLLDSEPFDLVYITTYPTYPALLGPMLSRRFGVGFVLDLQDPWVGEWGRTVGGGAGNAVDWRSRVSRWGAVWMEQRVMTRVDGLTAVSPVLLDQLTARYPALSQRPRLALPIGVDPGDVDALERDRIANPIFDPRDGRIHLSYVGAVLPLGSSTIGAFLEALAGLLQKDPSLRDRLRLHFVGSSNQSAQDLPPRVLPLAHAAGVGDIVTEHPRRIGYLESLRVLRDSSAVLLLGSSEQQYSPSKAYPALLAQRPILAAYRGDGPAADMLRSIGRAPSVRLVSLGFSEAGLCERLEQALAATLADLRYDPGDINHSVLSESLAPALARKLGELFDTVAAQTSSRRHP
jgi:Glycosyl transferase 4-like domain